MFITYTTNTLLVFTLFVGLGCLLILELWNGLMRAMGVVLLDKGHLGCRILSLFRQDVSFCPVCQTGGPSCDDLTLWRRHTSCYLPCLGRACVRREPFSRASLLCGRGLMYAFFLGFTLLLPLIWGPGFLVSPELWQVFLVGFLGHAICGLCTIAPLIGVGFFSLRHARPVLNLSLVLVAYGIFAMAQYVLACAFLPAEHLLRNFLIS